MNRATTPLETATNVAECLYAALRGGDAAAVDRLLAPDFRGHVTPEMPLGMGGDHKGPAEMRDGVWWRIGRHYVASAEPDEFRLLDDGRLFVRGHYRGHGRASGGALDAEFIHVITVDGERISALDQLTDSSAWTVALGEAGLETMDYAVSDGVAVVTLNRPAQRNAIDLALARDTLTVARRIEADSEVRAVLFQANGSDFSVGGDITYFDEHGRGDLGALLRTMTTPFHEAFRILSRVDAPIVTAAQGVVAGGAIGFVYASDVSFVSEDATIVTAFAALGVSGDGGGTWHLPRRIGAARAARVMLENTPISAQQAVAWGLVNEVVPGDELRDRAWECAAALAKGPTRGLGLIRRLLRETWTSSLSEQLAVETASLVDSGRTADTAAAIEAFLSKQPAPRFEGR